MIYPIDLITLDASFEPQLLRTVEVDAESGWDATVKAADLITDAESNHVFACTPETL